LNNRTTYKSARQEKKKLWLSNWSEGLAYCYHCDHEYTDAQAIEHKDEKSCPNCKNPERKTYYYCKEHGSPDDDCER
jgi:hypothetical protein